MSEVFRFQQVSPSVHGVLCCDTLVSLRLCRLWTIRWIDSSMLMCAWQWVSRAKADHICHYFSSSSIPHLLIHPRARLHGARAYDSDRRPDVRDNGHSVGDVKCESSVSLVRLWSLTCHCAHPFTLTRGCTTGSLLSDLALSLSCLVSDKWNALVCPNWQTANHFIYLQLYVQDCLQKSVFMSWWEVSLVTKMNILNNLLL